MTEQWPNVREALDGLDASRRETLSRLISGSVFVAPVVATFAMQGLSIRPADAPSGSSSNQYASADGCSELAKAA